MENIVVDDGLQIPPSRAAGVSVSRVCEGRELLIEPGFDVVHDLLEGVRHHFLHLVVGLVQLHHRRGIEVAAKNNKICLGDLDKPDQFINLLLPDLVITI